MKITTTRICPSGARRLCPTPDLCPEGKICYLQTAEGGRTFDSAKHEAPVAPPLTRRAPTFKPDYGIEHSRARVTYEITPLGWAAAIVAICAFVWWAINRF